MVINKIIAPENLSHKESFGTTWIADLEGGKQVWIQTSKDDDKPNWIRLGLLYEELFVKNPLGAMELLSSLEKSV